MPPPVLFAFGFANPLMLYGLGAASIPIVIHLLNKRKFRETRWAAMRFLLAAIRKNSKRIRLEQLLLLAVRTLLILLLAAAMAKPFLEQAGAIPVIAGRRTHRVLVLDGSLSMDYSAGGGTRFDRAKEVAAQFVKEARKGDVISLVMMGDPPRNIIKEPSPNHDEVLKELAAVTLPHGGTDLEASFGKVNEVLAASDVPQKEVVILTDLQAASWRKEGGTSDALKRALARLSARKPRSVVVDLGAPGGENVAVVDLRVDAPIVTMGSTPNVTATVKNFGRKAAEARVRFYVDHQQVGDQLASLKPGEDLPVAISYAFAAPGDHLVEAQIDDDPLMLDNRRCLAVPVRENLNVLLVDGDPKGEPFASEADYLEEALNPGEPSPGTPGLIRTEVIPASQLARVELAPFDAVVLCNLDQFNEPEVAALDAYVKQGGGLVVFGGDQVVAENYNRLLYADGKGLLPARVGPPVGNARDKAGSRFGFNALGFRHPIVAAYGGAPDTAQAGLTMVKSWEYHKLTLPKDSSARVALEFDTGDPAVIESAPAPGRASRGRVIQVATSADIGWTNWPIHPSYPPVMEQVILQAASGRRAERNVRVGQPLDEALPANGAGAAASVILPDAKNLPARLAAEGDVSRLHFAETDLSGAYQVKIGPPVALDVLFAAGTDPAESELTKLDGAMLKAALPGWSFQYEDDWRRLLRNVSAVGSRGELHRALLYAVLILLMAESILAWRFGHHVQ